MTGEAPSIRVLESRIEPAELARLVRLFFEDVEVNARRALRRELLRWRDLVAALYVDPAPSTEAHRAAFRALLQLSPATARQIPFVLEGR